MKDEFPIDELPKDELPTDERTLPTQIRNVAICARDEHFGEVVENITGRKVTLGTFTIIRKVLYMNSHFRLNIDMNSRLRFDISQVAVRSAAVCPEVIGALR